MWLSILQIKSVFCVTKHFCLWEPTKPSPHCRPFMFSFYCGVTCKTKKTHFHTHRHTLVGFFCTALSADKTRYKSKARTHTLLYTLIFHPWVHFLHSYTHTHTQTHFEWLYLQCETCFELRLRLKLWYMCIQLSTILSYVRSHTLTVRLDRDTHTHTHAQHT